jgi:hypothetical protein
MVTSGEPGPGVDAQGRTVIDPTQNVINTLDSAVTRLDDLRELQAESLRREMALRAEYEEKVRVTDAAYAEKLRLAESARIDAIRLVDTQQVQRAAEVQAAQALALATQVATSAEALRTQVATSAEALRTQAVAAQTQSDAKLAEALDPVRRDIADLRKVQYETAGGKTQVVEARSTTDQARLNIGALLGAASVFLVLVFGIASVAIALTR